MPKLKIALCTTDLDIGGAERCLTQLVTRANRERFEMVVYCLAARPPREDASCVPALVRAGVDVHFLDALHAWQFPAVTRKLRRLLSIQNPHVVQTFLFHANIVGRIAARRSGAAVVSAIRVAERAAHWHLWIDRLTERFVNRYVCVSRSVADFSTISGGLPPTKIVTIANGIDLGAYPACPADLGQFGVPPGRKVITFVGRLAHQKGAQWLIDTAPEWLESLPDCDLLMVGDGPLRHRLEHCCRASRIEGRVHFAGWRADVPEILAASHLLVLPSAWEGMPNVVLEAMASGLPVVASDVEGVQELLGPISGRQTVTFADSQGLISKIVGIAGDSALAAELGRNNRRRAEENFGIGPMVRAYEMLWESLVQRASGHSQCEVQ